MKGTNRNGFSRRIRVDDGIRVRRYGGSFLNALYAEQVTAVGTDPADPRTGSGSFEI